VGTSNRISSDDTDAGGLLNLLLAASGAAHSGLRIHRFFTVFFTMWDV
jgi:hypothetical protein